MASAACFLLHAHAPKAPSRRRPLLAVRPAVLGSCRAEDPAVSRRRPRAGKQRVENCGEDSAVVSRRVSLTVLVGAIATTSVGAKVSPADAAYGESANVFGKPKTNTEFLEYKGEGFKVLVPSKWNPSKEVEFPGQVMRYEDNFDSISNLSVAILDSDKNSVADYGTPEEFIGQFDYLLGKQTFSGKTESEGGFDASAVASANILSTSAAVVGGMQYYNISVLTRTADGDEGGKHQLITAAVKGKKLYICKAQAGDKRWFKGARKFVESCASSFNLA